MKYYFGLIKYVTQKPQAIWTKKLPYCIINCNCKNYKFILCQQNESSELICIISVANPPVISRCRDKRQTRAIILSWPSFPLHGTAFCMSCTAVRLDKCARVLSFYVTGIVAVCVCTSPLWSRGNLWVASEDKLRRKVRKLLHYYCLSWKT